MVIFMLSLKGSKLVIPGLTWGTVICILSLTGSKIIIIIPSLTGSKKIIEILV